MPRQTRKGSKMDHFYSPQREAEARETVMFPEQDLIDYRHHPDWTAPATDAGDHADVEMNP
jgi:hypothetical protein